MHSRDREEVVRVRLLYKADLPAATPVNPWLAMLEGGRPSGEVFVCAPSRYAGRGRALTIPDSDSSDSDVSPPRSRTTSAFSVGELPLQNVSTPVAVRVREIFKTAEGAKTMAECAQAEAEKIDVLMKRCIGVAGTSDADLAVRGIIEEAVRNTHKYVKQAREYSSFARFSADQAMSIVTARMNCPREMRRPEKEVEDILGELSRKVDIVSHQAMKANRDAGLSANTPWVAARQARDLSLSSDHAQRARGSALLAAYASVLVDSSDPEATIEKFLVQAE